MKKYKDVGIIIINFLRPEITKKCVKSLVEHAPGIQIYLGEQDKDSILEEWSKQYNNVKFVQLPFDCGISIARNKLVRMIREDGLKYIMWADNDFEFHKDSNIDKAKKVLQKDKSLGVVGGSLTSKGKIQHYERIFWHDRKRGILMHVPLEYTYPETQTVNGIDYFYCDLVFNFCMAKIKVFDNRKVRWVNRIKVKFEHVSFFLRLKENSNWKVAYCPSLHAIHHHERLAEYALFRNRNDDFKRFSEEFDLKVNMCFEEVCWDFVTEKILKPNELKMNSPTMNIKNKKNEEIIDLTKEIKINNRTSQISKIISFLNENNINYVLQKETCLDSIRFKKRVIKPKEFHIAVLNKNDKETIEKNFSDVEVNILIFKSTKKAILEDEKVNVPFPIVAYLTNYFGKDWKDIDNKSIDISTKEN